MTRTRAASASAPSLRARRSRSAEFSSRSSRNCSSALATSVRRPCSVSKRPGGEAPAPVETGLLLPVPGFGDDGGEVGVVADEGHQHAGAAGDRSERDPLPGVNHFLKRSAGPDTFVPAVLPAGASEHALLSAIAGGSTSATRVGSPQNAATERPSAGYRDCAPNTASMCHGAASRSRVIDGSRAGEKPPRRSAPSERRFRADTDLPISRLGVLCCPSARRWALGSTLLCVVKDQRRGAGIPVMGHVGTLLLGQCGPARVAVTGRQVDRRTTPAGSVRAILGQSRHRDPVAAPGAQVGICW
jgi:hypothetical protein